MNPPEKPNSSRLQLQEQFRIRLQKAKADYDDFSRHYSKVLAEQNQGLIPAPDGSHAVRQARVRESAALAEYMRVLRMFTELVIHDKLPEEH